MVTILAICFLGLIENMTSTSRDERPFWGPVNVLTFPAVLLIAVHDVASFVFFIVKNTIS